jgi:hypothetical protein
MNMRYICIIGIAVALAGCTSAQTAQNTALTSSVSADLAKISTFTVADLTNAEADAVANNDLLAAPCYPALAKFVASLQGANSTVSGGFSAFQKARDLRVGVQAGLPVYLKLACAPLVQNEAEFIASLAAIGGAATAVGPIAPYLLPTLTPPAL